MNATLPTPPAVGAWCEATRGFYEGGTYVRADGLERGDVFRYGTLAGHWVESVTIEPAGVLEEARVTVTTMNGKEHYYRPGTVLEVASNLCSCAHLEWEHDDLGCSHTSYGPSVAAYCGCSARGVTSRPYGPLASIDGRVSA